MKKKLITKNKKAYFDYEVLDTFQAGIILTGEEIKAIRQSQANLSGSFISIVKETAFVEKLNISRYKFSSNADYEPKRKRKLLLTKKEIKKIQTKLNESGIAVIPLELLIVNQFAKIIIGLCRGKKKYDKRENIKARELKRSLQKTIKKY